MEAGPLSAAAGPFGRAKAGRAPRSPERNQQRRSTLGPSDAVIGSAEFWLLTACGFLALFGSWAFVTMSGLVSARLLPSPGQVTATLIELTQHPYAGSLYQQHVLASIGRFMMGWALAVGIGLPLGLLMGWYRILDALLTPLFDAIRFVAPLAWVPLVALWFGTGIGGPLLIIFVGSFAPCLIGGYRGARATEQRFIEAAATLGANGRQIMLHVLLPSALPTIVSSLRISAGLGWQSLIGSELIVAGAGLGYLMVQGQSNLDTSVVVAGMVGIGVVGFLIDVILRAVERSISGRWEQRG